MESHLWPSTSPLSVPSELTAGSAVGKMTQSRSRGKEENIAFSANPLRGRSNVIGILQFLKKTFTFGDNITNLFST